MSAMVTKETTRTDPKMLLRWCLGIRSENLRITQSDTFLLWWSSKNRSFHFLVPILILLSRIVPFLDSDPASLPIRCRLAVLYTLGVCKMRERLTRYDGVHTNGSRRESDRNQSYRQAERLVAWHDGSRDGEKSSWIMSRSKIDLDRVSSNEEPSNLDRHPTISAEGDRLSR